MTYWFMRMKHGEGGEDHAPELWEKGLVGVMSRTGKPPGLCGIGSGRLEAYIGVLLEGFLGAQERRRRGAGAVAWQWGGAAPTTVRLEPPA
jgi:hypothetical protein